MKGNNDTLPRESTTTFLTRAVFSLWRTAMIILRVWHALVAVRHEHDRGHAHQGVGVRIHLTVEAIH